MPVKIVDRSAKVLTTFDDASRIGLAAAGNVLVREVKKAFGSDYYKGGAFRSTLQVRASIRRTDPVRDGGGWSLEVGTKILEALYWELGHYNIFTRKHERVRIWEPTMLEQAGAMRAEYAKIVSRKMGGDQ